MKLITHIALIILARNRMKGLGNKPRNVTCAKYEDFMQGFEKPYVNLRKTDVLCLGQLVTSNSKHKKAELEVEAKAKEGLKF